MTNDLPRVVESSGIKLVDTSAVWVPEGLIDGVVLPGSYFKINILNFLHRPYLRTFSYKFSLTIIVFYILTFTQTSRISDRS